MNIKEGGDGNEKETVNRGLLLFKCTFDKGVRRPTEKVKKKAKYFSSQKATILRITRACNIEQ